MATAGGEGEEIMTRTAEDETGETECSGCCGGEKSDEFFSEQF